MEIPLTTLDCLVRTAVSYKQSFFPLIYDPHTECTEHYQPDKRRIRNLQNRQRELKFSKIFIKSLRLTGHAERKLSNLTCRTVEYIQPSLQLKNQSAYLSEFKN